MDKTVGETEKNSLMKSGANGPVPQGRARYIMMGGFLGAGKTTAVGRLATHVKSKGLRVGLITNDEGKGLVDTATLRSQGFATEEIEGGCFCCRFDSLTQAADRLTATAQPQVLIAEPVGSCTDLVATVSYPLRKMYPNDFVIAPLSVLVDPIRAARIFALDGGGRFSDKLAYIYRKQLEEADIVVINKSDLAPAQKLQKLKQVLAAHAPEATVLTVSARTGEGLEEWFDYLMRNDHSSRDAMQLDYDIYAEGEMLLGWLNSSVRLSSVRYFNSSKVLTDLATCIQSLLQQEGAEVAHLKMTFNPGEDLGGIAVISLVRNDHVPELSQELPEPVQSGEMILNLRAEADPEILHSAVNRALLALVEKSPELFARMEHSEHFRPGKPAPTHRMARAA
jgi:G3E family GTPase